MARVRNLSSHDYGCTQVTIDRAGTGTKPFLSTDSKWNLMDKTFRITPARNNTSGNYEVTLYFTAAEKAGWESATGNSWNNIKLVKTAGPISSVTPSTPNGGGTIEAVTPVFGTLGTHFTLSYSFNTGFSGFGAGIPVEPCVAPAITVQPAATVSCEGSTATLSVTVTGTSLQYQWRKNSEDIEGATARTLTLSNL
jgi:hypothetical protein